MFFAVVSKTKKASEIRVLLNYWVFINKIPGKKKTFL